MSGDHILDRTSLGESESGIMKSKSLSQRTDPHDYSVAVKWASSRSMFLGVLPVFLTTKVVVIEVTQIVWLVGLCEL